MRVLLLSPYPERLAPTILGADDEYTSGVESLTNPSADWIISFGYRHIIREPYLSQFRGRMINIHISMLPWNRGADPNFWSWFDRTPKGVSIHLIDAGIDTGDILVQAEVRFESGMTLRTSYDVLIEHAVRLFDDSWRMIRRDALPTKPTKGVGTYHRASDKAPWWRLLSREYDTPVAEIEEIGSRYAASMLAGPSATESLKR